MSSKNKFIEGLKTIAGWAIFVVIILFLVRSCGGEAEDLDTSDPKLTQEQSDWYNKKKEEEDEYGLYCGPFQKVWGYKFDGWLADCVELTTDNYYFGPWKDNERHGWGVMEWPDGTKYIGNFKEGYREGFGTVEWAGCSDDANNKKYEGSWKRGDRHGQGTLTKCDDTTYEGNFKNHARHGRFKVTASNEEMEVVYYTENKKVEEICEEIGFSKDSSKYEDCIIELVAETLSLE